jgi:hypothetical protein
MPAKNKPYYPGAQVLTSQLYRKFTVSLELMHIYPVWVMTSPTGNYKIQGIPATTLIHNKKAGNRR